MIKVKLRDWVEVYGLVNTSTVWELATDPEMTNIIYTKEDDVNLSYFSYDIDVPLDTIYYLRATRKLNYGNSEVKSSVIAIEAEDIVRNNIILDRDLKIDTPSVYVHNEDIDIEDNIRVSTSTFRSTGDQHSYTHWLLEDATGKTLWKSLYDKTNLTSIDIPNVGQPYMVKSKLVFKAIHGTKVGMESKVGNFAIFLKNVNFEIITNLSMVKALQDLKIEFKKIDKDLRLGISSIDIIDTSTESIMKSYYDVDESGIVVNWWLCRHGVELKMSIKCIDVNDNIITLNKRITVESYNNEVVKDPKYKYTKDLSNFFSSDSDSNADFYIPNNYSCEALHNGYLPIPKLGEDNKLYYYDMDKDKKLKIMGYYSGIEISKDTTKEGMLVRRVNNDLIMISHSKQVGGMNQHEMMFYKYNTQDGSYSLLKQFDVEGENYSLGFTNGILQTDNKTIYYIPTNTDILKKLDLEMLAISTVSENIPYVTTEDADKVNDPNRKIVTPIMIRLSDGRILIIGGYSPNGTTYDPYTNTFQESVFWENESFIGNKLNVAPLINGDAIVIKKEDEVRSVDDSLDNIYNDNDLVIIKSLEELYAEINKDENMGETRFSTDLDRYVTTVGSDLEITIDNNFTTNDIRQYYLTYDRKVFRLDERTTNKLKFHILTHAKTGNKEIRIIASKDQIFDQSTFLHTQSFTNKVVNLTIPVEVDKTADVTVDNDLEIIKDEDSLVGYYDPNLNSMEAEYLQILGNKTSYGSGELDIKVYKEEVTILFPVETVNVSVDDLEFEHKEDLGGFLDFRVIVKTNNLFLLEISNILIDDPFKVTLKNKLREAEFVTLKFTFLDTPIKGLPSKVKLIRNNKEYLNGDTLTFFDNISYSLNTNEEANEPKFLLNRSDVASFSMGAGLNKYMISIRKKSLVPLIVSSKDYPDDVYCNNIFYINPIDAVPKLDIAIPNIALKINESTVAKITNNWVGIDKDSTKDGITVEISQNLLSKNLLTATYVDGKVNLDVKDKYGTGSFTITVKNIADKSLKQSVFNFTVYDADSYPIGLVCTFPDSTTGGSGEKLYVNPGQIIPFDYSRNGNKVTFDMSRGSIFNVDETSNSLITTPKLYINPERDLGKDDAVFRFYNKTGSVISSLTKSFFMIPIIFYTRDSFMGDVLVDNYNFTMQNGTEEEFIIIPKAMKGYKVTTIKVNSLRTYLDVKFYLKSIPDDEEGAYSFVISTPDSEETNEYAFTISYTYVNNNGNDILTVTEEYQQTFKVKSVYYKQQAYLSLETNRLEIVQNETKEIKLTTNGKYVTMTPGEQGLISVDNDSKTVTGLKPGRASLIVRAGSPEQVLAQDLMFITITEPKPEEELPQGYVDIAPSIIKLFPGTKISIDISTNAEHLVISVEDTKIATYDSIKNEVIAKGVGETRLKIVYTGSNIKGSTKYFPIIVRPLPEGDPDIAYYDSFNHVLSPTELYFNDIYPNSVLVSRSGEVILSCYKKVDDKREDSEYRTYYVVFY